MEFIFYLYIGYIVYLKKSFFLKIKKNKFCKNVCSKLIRKFIGIWEVNCIYFKKCMIV